MAIADPSIVIGPTTDATRRPIDAAARRTFADVAGFVRDLRRFTVGLEGRAVPVVLFGLAIAAFDILVPIVGSQVVDAMSQHRPFQEVAILIVALAAIIWVPHGNLLPYCLERWELKRFRVPLARSIAVRALTMTLANPDNPAKLATGAMQHGDAQPILVEARENIGKLACRFLRDLPAALRGLVILLILSFLVPMFVPFLLLAAAIDLWITYRMGRNLRAHFQARQDAENAQRRLENAILARHFGTSPDAAEIEAIVAPYRAAATESAMREIEAEGPVLGYKLRRDLVSNASNITSWLVGAWYVMVDGNPIGSFLFFIAWSARAGELFAVIMNLQQEMMKARRSVRQLTELTGIERHEARALLVDPVYGKES